MQKYTFKCTLTLYGYGTAESEKEARDLAIADIYENITDIEIHSDDLILDAEGEK